MTPVGFPVDIRPPVGLTVAGSDSAGGAGVQVDIKTFCAHGIFPTTAITAVTVQNSSGVRSVHPVPPSVVADQIIAVTDDVDVSCAKTGMLASGATVRAVAGALREREIPVLVVDPVMVSSKGDRLLDDEGTSSYIGFLLPIAFLVTPNMDEASILAGGEITTVEHMESAASAIASLGARHVLITGGHLPGSECVDVLSDGRTVRRYSSPRIPTENTHGTGCTLSASIAALLAQGHEIAGAVAGAKEYVSAAIAGSVRWRLGAGHGPLNHFPAADTRAVR